MSSVDFVLEALESQVQMSLLGSLPAANTPALTGINAVAEYWVSVSDMKNAFYFQTDSNDINDVSGSDVTYYVNWPSYAVLNPAHALVTTDPISAIDQTGANLPSNRKLVKHDFVRHISKDLFATHFGVDLFTNEQQLKDNLAQLGHNVWDPSGGGGIKSKLESANGLNEGNVGNNNICRVLLQQVLFSQRDRLSNLPNIKSTRVGAPANEYSIPFANGDSIQFKVTVKADPTQHTVVRSSTLVADRTYKIKINVVTSVGSSNVVVDDCVALPTLNTSAVRPSA